MERNSQNYKQYATEGVATELSLTYTLGDEKHHPGSNSPLNRSYSGSHKFFTLKGKYDNHFPITRRSSIGVTMEAVYSNKELLNNYSATLLAANTFAPTPFSQTMFLENYRANKYVASGLKSIIELSSQMHLRMEGYAFVPVTEISMGDNYQAINNPDNYSDLNLMGMAGLVYHTALGPVSLTLNYFEKPNTKFYVVFNFGYVLFNKRGY
jgi:NTE family protein